MVLVGIILVVWIHVEANILQVIQYVLVFSGSSTLMASSPGWQPAWPASSRKLMP